jgi:hypothetical protein
MAVEQAERTRSTGKVKGLQVLVGPFSPPIPPPVNPETSEYPSLFEVLRDLLENYSNQIPTQIIHSTDPSPNYKCRNGWFALVIGTLYDPDLEPLISNIPNLQTNIDNLYSFCTKFASGRRNTRAQIDFADSIIKEVLAQERPILSVEELMEKPMVPRKFASAVIR